MRKRALLVGGDLTFKTAADGGGEVRLRVPAAKANDRTSEDTDSPS
jgi:hypothetical protein